MSEHCARAGWWIGGCRFEPRYDLGEPTLDRFGKVNVSDPTELMEASKPKTYVHDVCIRCGKTVAPERVVTYEQAPNPTPANGEAE